MYNFIIIFYNYYFYNCYFIIIVIKYPKLLLQILNLFYIENIDKIIIILLKFIIIIIIT